MKDRPFLCGACHKRFTSQEAVEQHARAAHPKAAKVHVFRRVSTIVCAPDDDHESFADRARAAEIALAMGDPTDDAWLLGEG